MNLYLVLSILIAFLAGACVFLGYSRHRQAKFLAKAKSGNLRLAADLDSIITDDFGFQLGGQVHVITPMSMERFTRVNAALAHLDELGRRKSNSEELAKARAYLDELQRSKAEQSLIEEMMARIEEIKSAPPLADQIINAYEVLFREACPSVTRAVLDKMTYPQIGALLNAIMEYMVGKAHLQAEKKSPKLGEE